MAIPAQAVDVWDRELLEGTVAGLEWQYLPKRLTFGTPGTTYATNA